MNAILPVFRSIWAALVATVITTLPLPAFPPAPDHLVYGYVRDEQGVPLNRPEAEVLLEANGKILSRAPITISTEPGVNYRLAIPLDSGVTGDLYTPTALRPTVPFRLRVKVGNLTYLPIEMTGASNLVTRPGASSRVDLTLGVDSDGDGIPDAWEYQVIAALGGGKSLSDIGPNDDSDGDGLSNLQEYLAGTYAFDSADGFNLAIVSTIGDRSVLEFMAIRGRTYSLRVSEDLETWRPIPFNMSTDPAGTPASEVFRATDTRIRRPVVRPPAEGEGRPQYFKLIVH